MDSLKWAILFIAVSVILGAFGAHYLKTILDQGQLDSFQTSVTYLMYTGLGLLGISSLKHHFQEKRFNLGSLLIIYGTLLFSISIIVLIFTRSIDLGLVRNIIGILTPLGGVSIILGWSTLFISLFQNKVYK